MVAVDLQKSWGRRAPGQAQYVRRSAHWEFYKHVDPDTLRHSERPPPEVEAAMKDILGDRCKDLKLVIHPLLKRWTLFERIRDPKSGQTACWGIVTIFQEEPREGYLPQDLRGSKWLAHLTGQIGDFRLPNRRDFEIIDKADVVRYGYKAVDEMLEAPLAEEARDKERAFNDKLEDVLDYNFWLAMRDAQAHYSQPWSTRPIEAKTNPARWRQEQRNGYKLRTRVWGAEGDANALEAVLQGEKDGLRGDFEEAARRAAVLEMSGEGSLLEQSLAATEANQILKDPAEAANIKSVVDGHRERKAWRNGQAYIQVVEVETGRVVGERSL